MDTVYSNLYSRGLFRAADFICAFGPHNTLDTIFWEPTSHQKLLESKDMWILKKALSYLTSKQFQLASKATRYGKSQKSIFIHLYSLYMDGEIRALESKLKNQDTQALVTSKKGKKGAGSYRLPSDPIMKPPAIPIYETETNIYANQILFQLSRIKEKDPFLEFLLALAHTSLGMPRAATKSLISSLNLFPWNWSAWKALKRALHPLVLPFPDFIIPNSPTNLPPTQPFTPNANASEGDSDIIISLQKLDDILSGTHVPVSGYSQLPNLNLQHVSSPGSGSNNLHQHPHPEELITLDPNCSNFVQYFLSLSDHFSLDPSWKKQLLILADELNELTSLENTSKNKTKNKQNFVNHLLKKFVIPESFPFSGTWADISIPQTYPKEPSSGSDTQDLKLGKNNDAEFITVYPFLPSIEFLQQHPTFFERFDDISQNKPQNQNQKKVSSDQLYESLVSCPSIQPIKSHWMVTIFQILYLLASPNNAQVFTLAKPLISHFPQVPYVNYLVGKAYYTIRKYNDAELVFKHVESLDPLFTTHYPLLSNMYYIRQKSVLLHALAKKCTFLQKYTPDTCIVLGNYYSSRNDSHNAMLFLSRAVKLAPDNSLAWTLLGHELINISSKASALHAYSTAIRVDPSDFRPWYAMGYLLEIIQKYNYALYHYRRAIALQPNDARIWNAIANVYQSLKNPDQAIRCYTKAWECDNSMITPILSAAALAKEGKRFPLATSLYRRCVPILLVEDPVEAVEPLRFLATFANYSSRFQEAYQYASQLKQLIQILQSGGVEMDQEMKTALLQAEKIEENWIKNQGNEISTVGSIGASTEEVP